MRALLLVAGRGRRLWGFTRGPKCLLEIGGVPLIHRYLDALALLKPSITEVIMVVGYKADEIRISVDEHPMASAVNYIHNNQYEKGSILSLEAGLKAATNSDILLMDGDVYFEPELLRRLVESSPGNVLLMDTRSKNTGEEIMVGATDESVVSIGRGMEGVFELYGEWIGFLRMTPQASSDFLRLVDREVRDGHVMKGYEDALQALTERVPFRPCLVDDLRWTEIDFPGDVVQAQELASS